MAYSKKTWKARQGLGLNKFSIDGATPVAIVNQPDSVTQQGDALSAGNLNDLEDRIANAFDDVEESKVDKSTTDDLQNQIVNLNTDVATLDAIVGSEAEIENTDPSEGQSVLSSSRLIHHVNLLPSGEFGLVGARDIVHEGSIVNLNPTGFSIRGINLWDEETELGIYDITTGQSSSSSINLRFKNRTDILPSTTYYFKRPSLTIVALWYDSDDNYISYTSVTSGTNTATSPSNAVYLRCYLASEYGTTYNHDIQIADNTLPSSLKTVYHPYSGQTVPVSISGHYVNENVYDYVTNKMVDGVLRGEVHTKVGSVVITSSNLSDPTDNGNRAIFNVTILNPIKYSSSADVPNILMAGFNAVSQNTTWVAGQVSASVTSLTSIYVIMPTGTTKADMLSLHDGDPIYYEFATEVITYTEPLRSFSVSDYCTIEPITPQTLPNRVDVPFSVLSKSNNGLIEQIRTNTADIADHSAILSQHEARIANLEQISGDYVTEDMQDYSTVPTGKASFALVETLKGVSRVENNLVPLASGLTKNGYSVSDVSNGKFKLTVTDTSSTARIEIPNSMIAGHKYLVSFEVTAPVSTNIQAILETTWQTLGSTTANAKFTYSSVFLKDSNFSTFVNMALMIPANGMSVGNTVDVSIIFCDLTLYFNGNIPTNADTVAHIAQYYPELLEPRAYNAGSLVTETVSGVKSVGKNILDIDDLLSDSGWSKQADGSWKGLPYLLANIKFTSLEYGSRYTISINAKNSSFSGSTLLIGFYYTDGTRDRVSIDTTSDTTYTVSSASGKIIDYVGFSYFTNSEVVVNWIQIEKGTSATDYVQYETHTLTLSTPFTGKSAGSVSDTLDVESGEITRRIGSVDLGTLNWNKHSSGNFFAQVSNMVKFPSAGYANILCAEYSLTSTGAVSSHQDMDKVIFGNSNDNYIVIRDSAYLNNTAYEFKSAMSGKILYYELATPTTDSVTPTLNNTLKTEGGGTVYTDADVDGQFTLGFLNL